MKNRVSVKIKEKKQLNIIQFQLTNSMKLIEDKQTTEVAEKKLPEPRSLESFRLA